MKKFISVLVCFLIMFSFSFADDTKKIEDTWYISEDAVCKMWNTDVLVYSNSSIVNTSKYPDNVIYKNVDLTKESSPYTVKILTSDLRKSWTPGMCYKIQLRFGSTSFPSDLSSFATWKKEQINNQTFSEWSTVMVIKAIAQPKVYIENASIVRVDVIASKQTESSLTPLFTGGYIDDASDEPLDKYKLLLQI